MSFRKYNNSALKLKFRRVDPMCQHQSKRLEQDVRKIKTKEAKCYKDCNAILAYRTKAFKKTKDHAAKIVSSLRKGWRLEIES